MRVAIAGAGNVGRSIAQELIDNGHQVMLIERQPKMLRPERVPAAEWVLADACELASLEEADVAGCDVVVAATGDDKVNLVVSLLAKTEFAVPRVVARVNRAENEWLFTEQWGVDVAVSKPRLMAALVEEAVTRRRPGPADDVPAGRGEPGGDHPAADRAVRRPAGARRAAAARLGAGRRSCAASGCWCRRPDDPLEAGDELIFVCTAEVEDGVRAVDARPGQQTNGNGPRGRTLSPAAAERARTRLQLSLRGRPGGGSWSPGGPTQTVRASSSDVRRAAERQPGDAEQVVLLVEVEPRLHAHLGDPHHRPHARSAR